VQQVQEQMQQQQQQQEAFPPSGITVNPYL
jgi:hypothetical protein